MKKPLAGARGFLLSRTIRQVRINPEFTFLHNNPRRLNHPINRAWLDAALAVCAAIGPIKLPVLLNAGTGAAEHFPSVGTDVGGARPPVPKL